MKGWGRGGFYLGEKKKLFTAANFSPFAFGKKKVSLGKKKKGLGKTNQRELKKKKRGTGP